jgi:hypothetical protein
VFKLTPSGELLTHFPLVLVPTFLVPLAITLHMVSLCHAVCHSPTFAETL